MAHQFPRKTMSLALQKKFASGILVELHKDDSPKQRRATIQFGDNLYSLLSDPEYPPDGTDPSGPLDEISVILHDHNTNLLYPVTIEQKALNLADVSGIDEVFESLIDADDEEDEKTPTTTVTGFTPPPTTTTTTTTKPVTGGRGAIPPTPPSGELLELP